MIDFIAIVLIFLLVYPFAIYPIVLAVSSFLFAKPLWYDYEYQPEVSVLIAAHNEEDYIIDCINSIINLDYPKNKIRVLVGSDGSTDRTNAILEQFKTENKINLDYFIYDRVGKNSVINNLVKEVKTDLIFFLDADHRFSENVFIETLKYFVNDEVGATMVPFKYGQKSMQQNTGSRGETFYQLYEDFLRDKESEIGTVVNAMGTYCIRRNLLDPIHNSKLADDSFNILNVGKKGKRVIFVKNILIYEVRDKTLKDEMFRRERTFSGGFSTLYFMDLIYKVPKDWFSFFVFSHKLFRYFAPVLIIMLIMLSFVLSKSTFIGAFTIYSLVLFFSFAFIGFVLSKLKIYSFIFQAPLFFLTLMIGYVLGFQKFVSGNFSSKWSHTSK